VTNLAARLCGAAGPWQVLASRRVFHAAEPAVGGESIGELSLVGFSRPTGVFNVTGVSGPGEVEGT
ncbi:MAG: Adenylate cyclase, class 3, partial [Friedmanniella sp.]|nr:Adenylate cyclase, class 3 [Friedmanniella sp.]